MKKLFLSFVLFSIAVMSFAYTAQIGKIYYNLSGNEATVTYKDYNYNSYSGAVVIPSSVTYNGTTYSVTCIGSYAFQYCSGLTSVTIPNSVTSIERLAFYDCSGLTSITIPNSVNSIGIDAFYHCSGLTSVTIPNSVTSIGSYAFSGCSSLTSITIPNSVTSVGDFAFAFCTGLTSVNIPEGVTRINRSVFSGCTGLTSVTIPNSVTWIDSSAFWGCTSLTSVTIPNSVTWIGAEAFSGCSSLTSVTIPNSVTNIVNSAFSGCTGLTSVTIPNSVTNIGDSAFSGCTGLTSITIGNGVTYIGSYAFDNCSSLMDVYCYAVIVPSTRKEIFKDVNTSSVTLHVPKASLDTYRMTEPWSRFGAIYPIDDTPSIIFADANVKALCVSNWDTSGDEELNEAEAAAVTDLGEVFTENTTITSFNELQYFTGLTTISDRAFFGCSGLTSVTIPNSVTSIERLAFYDCSGLTSVTIPNSVTSIGEGAFDNCTGLTSVTIPNSVTSVGDFAFYGCSSLTSVTIPNSVTSIGEGAFSGCTSLTSVYMSDLEAWCKIAFIDFYSNPFCEANQSTHLFLNEEEIKDLVIPNSVTSIGGYAFLYCSGLTSVTIPNSVTNIGDGAFLYCSGLTSVTIPYSVTSIGEAAFATGGLTSINVEDGNPVYDSRGNCNAIIKTATNTLVAGCQTTTIPNSVTSIGFGAFVSCSGLTSVTIPNSVTSIGDYAFLGCGSLTDVYCFAKNVPSINENTFYRLKLSSMTLHVLASVVNSYKAAKYWRNFGTILGMREDIVATGIQLNMTSLKLNGIGSTEQLIATVSPSNATNQNVTWRSTDVTVVTVDDNGLVTAVGAGNAQVIATTTDGSNLTASCLIDVTLGNSKPGDVNGDGDVNSGDVMSIYSIMAGRSSLDRELGDVNGDGQVNSGDVMRVYSIMAGNY